MKCLEWILKSELSPISCLVGWYLLWFSSIYFSCPYILVHSWFLTVSIFKDFILLFTKLLLKYLSLFCSRWICISHRWIWSISYSHASMANTGRNGYFQDFLYVQVFSHLCDGWIFPYTFFNTVQYYDKYWINNN